MSLSLHAASTDSCSEAVVCCKVKSPHSFSIHTEKVSTGGGLHALKRHSESALSSGISYHTNNFISKYFARKRKKEERCQQYDISYYGCTALLKLKKYDKKVLHREGW